MHAMLTGVTPFGGDNVVEVLQNIAGVELDWDEEPTSKLSQEGKDLMQSLFMKNP